MKLAPSKRITAALTTSLLVLLAACGPEPQKQPAPQKAPAPAEPQIPAEVQAAAETALGAEVTVLAYGDLSLSGQPQILAVQMLKTTPTGVAPGILFSRLVILGLEKKGNAPGQWKELLICTGHLQNPSGYLGGTPLTAINGWRLQKESSPSKGLVMYFTPIRQPVAGTVRPISVYWNPKVKRYQSLDFNYENFLNEVKSINKPDAFLR